MKFSKKILIINIFTAVLLSTNIYSQKIASENPPGISENFSNHIEHLTERVSQSVVQILVTAYGPGYNPALSQFVKVKGSGSGFIVDPSGFIITNSHVVDGAIKIKVKLPSIKKSKNSKIQPAGKIVDAEIIGIDKLTDLALLRIEGDNYPVLHLANSDEVKQGKFVLAFGNPMGLDNSVTMGIVSAVSRQLKEDDLMIYIQTDTPINPGNSGGPLVDFMGSVIGVNTMIFSHSGGSEGIGFAIPSNIVKYIYNELKQNGRVRNGQIGVNAQTITPLISEGLGLRQTSGVIISDVYPGSPAYAAGLKEGDVVLTMDGKVLENARQFDVLVFIHRKGDVLSLEVLRGLKRYTFKVEVTEFEGSNNFANLVDPENNLIPEFGILGLELSSDIKSLLPPIRKDNGVIVAGLVGNTGGWEGGFMPGDIIYSVNRAPIINLEVLKEIASRLPNEAAVVVQLERNGQLMYLTFVNEK